MIDIKKIRDDFDATAAALARRGVEKETVQKAKDLDLRRRALIAETETLKSKRNSASKEIGAKAKAGEDVTAAKAEVRAIGDRIAAIDGELAQILHGHLLSQKVADFAQTQLRSHEVGDGVLEQLFVYDDLFFIVRQGSVFQILLF